MHLYREPGVCGVCRKEPRHRLLFAADVHLSLAELSCAKESEPPPAGNYTVLSEVLVRGKQVRADARTCVGILKSHKVDFRSPPHLLPSRRMGRAHIFRSGMIMK